MLDWLKGHHMNYQRFSFQSEAPGLEPRALKIYLDFRKSPDPDYVVCSND